MGAYRSADATCPAHGAVEITPSDSATFPVCRSLYIGIQGALTVRMADGMAITFPVVPVGIFPIQVYQVMDTNTDADDIIALY
jgi:hypothetical protein